MADGRQRPAGENPDRVEPPEATSVNQKTNGHIDGVPAGSAPGYLLIPSIGHRIDRYGCSSREASAFAENSGFASLN
jgi:hypothetical protein